MPLMRCWTTWGFSAESASWCRTLENPPSTIAGQATQPSQYPTSRSSLSAASICRWRLWLVSVRKWPTGLFRRPGTDIVTHEDGAVNSTGRSLCDENMSHGLIYALS